MTIEVGLRRASLARTFHKASRGLLSGLWQNRAWMGRRRQEAIKLGAAQSRQSVVLHRAIRPGAVLHSSPHSIHLSEYNWRVHRPGVKYAG